MFPGAGYRKAAGLMPLGKAGCFFCIEKSTGICRAGRRGFVPLRSYFSIPGGPIIPPCLESRVIRRKKTLDYLNAVDIKIHRISSSFVRNAAGTQAAYLISFLWFGDMAAGGCRPADKYEIVVIIVNLCGLSHFFVD